jgi:hypothetical protein
MIFFLKGNHGLFTNGQRTYRDINKVFDDPGKVSFRGSVLFRSPSYIDNLNWQEALNQNVKNVAHNVPRIFAHKFHKPRIDSSITTYLDIC